MTSLQEDKDYERFEIKIYAKSGASFLKNEQKSITSGSYFGSVTPKFNITQCYWYGFSTESIKLLLFYQNICCTWSDGENIMH